MARKKKDNVDFDSNIPENEELPEDVHEADLEEEEEGDQGVDEVFGSTNPGRAGRDLDDWGVEDD